MTTPHTLVRAAWPIVTPYVGTRQAMVIRPQQVAHPWLRQDDGSRRISGCMVRPHRPASGT